MAECKGLALVTLARNENGQYSEGEVARVATFSVYNEKKGDIVPLLKIYLYIQSKHEFQ